VAKWVSILYFMDKTFGVCITPNHLDHETDPRFNDVSGIEKYFSNGFKENNLKRKLEIVLSKTIPQEQSQELEEFFKTNYKNAVIKYN
jgi:hypothetical protein